MSIEVGAIEAHLIGPLLIVAGIVVPGVTPIGGGGSHHHKEEFADALGYGELGLAFLVALHVAIHGFALLGVGHKAIAPSGVVGSDGTVAIGTGNAFEVGFHHGARCGGVQVDDVVAIVLRTARRVDSPCAVVGSCLVQTALVLSDAVAGLFANAVDVPGGHAGEAVEHLVVKFLLREVVESFIGLQGVFGFHRLPPQAANKVLSVFHAPGILHEAVLVAPLFVHHAQVTLGQMSLEVFSVGELAVGINLVGLPVGTALPPAVATRGIVAIAIVVAVGHAQVGRNEILEGVPYLVCHGMSSTSTDGPRAHMSDARLGVNTRCVGPPFGLVEHIELNLIGVGGGVAWLQESQLVHIHIPDVFGLLQHTLRVEPVGGCCPRGVGTEALFPEHHKVFALPGAFEAPLRVVVHVVVGSIGGGVPENAPGIAEEHGAGHIVAAHERLQGSFGVALGKGGAIHAQHGNVAAIAQAELYGVVVLDAE